MRRGDVEHDKRVLIVNIVLAVRYKGKL
jgi:hypothetical protein